MGDMTWHDHEKQINKGASPCLESDQHHEKNDFMAFQAFKLDRFPLLFPTSQIFNYEILII